MRMHRKDKRGSPEQVAALVLLFATVHSLLASWQAKAWASRLLGARYRNGLYRLFYIVQSLVFTAWATWRFLKLPDRELYRVPAPWSWLMHAGQLLPLSLLVAAARVVGYGRITGIEPTLELLRGRFPDPEPAAQGPPLAPDGEMRVEGPFRWFRHPANFGPIPFFLLFPTMTVNRLTLASLVSSYLILGSVHEEYRLRRAYGAAYLRYQQVVPFLLPRSIPPRRGVDETG